MSGGKDAGVAERITISGVNSALNKHLQDCAVQSVKTEAAVTALTVAMKTQKDSIGEVVEAMKDLQSNAWKALGVLVAIILTAAVTLLFQNLQFKQQMTPPTIVQQGGH